MDPSIDCCQYKEGIVAVATSSPTVVPTSPAQVDACCPAPLQDTALGEAEAVDLARRFAALSDPVRLRLLSLLATAADGAICVCDLVEPVGKSQPTVSHHLKVLREAGLVTSEKRGTNVWYAAVPAALEALRDVLAPRR
ncbi:helix-turn-helix transcriptional regulator [Actinotalea ferrariae]|uniref:ArsR/SmtB family transcription factor n=1 Tax=Actinotalea ferrariae TaxID=1386098 RepID=UPI001C8C4B1C|nr:metalloregulator ArsR/SmtB family transcription factor [Actinotalea ferrariae]MBX9244144.1 helix-turn-helix transcriptional regulator [Actinotalea ferrariae]